MNQKTKQQKQKQKTNQQQQKQTNQQVKEQQQQLGGKLLTLLNVVATKPTRNNSSIIYHTDWNQISKRQITDNDQNNQSKFNNNQEEVQNLISSKQEQPLIDIYSSHFGPESSIPNPQSLLDNEKWSISSKSSQNNIRIVKFKPHNHSPASSDASPIIPPRFQSAIQYFNSQQNLLFNSINHYQDVWHTDLPYNHSRADVRAPTSIWLLQHILKTRNQIIKNNEHLSHSNQQKIPHKPSPLGKKDQSQVQPSQTDQTSHPPNDQPDIRDQGFTRPKVLILLPFRSNALDWIKTITSVSSSADLTVKGLERFNSDFSLPEGTVDKLTSHDAQFKYSLDHRIIFRGNIDDDFKLAVKFNRKEIKLYSEFYQADLIIASPVGLRKFIEKQADSDFLSSIEIVIVDQMDVMQMQNWEHLEFVFEHLNQIPARPRDTDFSRVKPWYLDGLARHHRQTILFSSFTSPEQNSLFRSLANASGKSLYFHQTEAYRSGLLCKIKKGIQQTWLKLDHTSLDHTNEDDRRFEFFRSNILNLLQQSATVKAGLGRVLIFIPNYFDFVRLENLFKSIDDLKFAAISEYSTPSEISAARSSFFNSHVSYLLVTERFHFYHRYKLRGARRIIFYGAPLHPEYYLEFVNEYPFLENLNKSLLSSSETHSKKTKKQKKNNHDQQRELELELEQQGENGDLSSNSHHLHQDSSSGKDSLISPDELGVQIIFSKFDKFKMEKIIGLNDCSKILKTIESSDDSNNVNSFTFI